METVCAPVVFRKTVGETLTAFPISLYLHVFLFCAEAPGGKDAPPAARIRTSRNARSPDERRRPRRPSMKGFRRIFSRFEKFDVIFLGFIVFARIFDALR